MNRPFLAADARLTAVQSETLSLVLNMIVPPSTDGSMPGAAEMAVLVHHIADAQSGLPALPALLDRLERESIARWAAGFAALDENKRAALFEEMRTRDPVALDQLALETVTCYYQQGRVLEGLGMEARPPFPKGYQVEQGDLSLLNPVIARGRMYRDID